MSSLHCHTLTALLGLVPANYLTFKNVERYVNVQLDDPTAPRADTKANPATGACLPRI